MEPSMRSWLFSIILILATASELRAQAPVRVASHQKISATAGGFGGALSRGDAFGSSVAFLGDVDGDGVGDLAVGVPYDGGLNSDTGSIYIVFLHPDGSVKTEQNIALGGFNGLLDAGDQFGLSLTALGDLDGDGVCDLAVGAPGDDDGGTNRGAVWILFLNADGTVETEQKVSASAGGFGGVLQDFIFFGTSVASLGDLDGDGVGDIAVGAWGYPFGAVWIVFLDTDGTVKAQEKTNLGGYNGPLDTFDRFGSSVAPLGDLDGDGVCDLAVGAPFDDGDGDRRGAVWILFLDTDGTVAAEQEISDVAGGFQGILDDLDFFGASVVCPGDLDGDGVGDLAVGATHDDDGGGVYDVQKGAVWVLFLDTDGTVKSKKKISATAGGFDGVLRAGSMFGASLSTLGDLDGDGVGDLAVGASGDSDGGEPPFHASGAVWILFMGPDRHRRSAGSVGAGTTLTLPLTVVSVRGLLASIERAGFDRAPQRVD